MLFTLMLLAMVRAMVWLINTLHCAHSQRLVRCSQGCWLIGALVKPKQLGGIGLLARCTASWGVWSMAP